MLVSRAALACASIACASLVACFVDDPILGLGTSSGTGGAGGTGGASASSASQGGAKVAPLFVEGPHSAAPQVVNATHGHVMPAPRIQVLSYASDPLASDVDKFIAELTATSTWSEQTAEYGVGPFTVLPTIHLTEPPPAKLDDDSADPSPFQVNIAAQLTGADPAWGAADPGTVYLFLLPLGTDISSYGKCCTDFLGYHNEAPVAAASVSYAIICDCPPAKMDPLTPLQWVTTTVIHEMVEAATDPFYYSDPAFGETDDADVIWSIATGGELADMCEYNDDTNYLPPGATYMIQRSWSDAAAKAGKNPCVPAATDAPYFNSMPVLGDAVSVNYYGKVNTHGVKIPVKGTRTIDVQLFSEAETSGPWKVKAYDLGDYLGGKAHLTLSLDKTSGSNGDKLALTITVLSVDKSFGGEGFVLVSELDGQSNLSMGVVGN